MEAEIGHFFCISALCLSLLIFLRYSFPGFTDTYFEDVTKFTPSLIFILIGISFVSLSLSFVNSDFSVKLVANNSHTLKPLIYKISGVWGNHEGSMLLWVWILAFYLMLFQIFSKKLPSEFVNKTIFIQLSVISLFLLYLVLVSNPFERLNYPPAEGDGLNPVLQDILLAFHPPILYLGYLGLSIPFSLALGFLLSNDKNVDVAKVIRFWALLSFFFLSLGILLGSIWAYYELGWGGWWFWDPVENASLLPWLLTLALIHSLLVLERRGYLISWVLLLSIMAFSFSLIGTFIVRSGLLTSVHAFANDPSRGLFILLLIFLAIGLGLSIFIARKPIVLKETNFNLFSKELWILLNNVILLVITSIVFLGTIWPFLVEAFSGDQVSVGKPFYDLSLTPFVIIFAFLLPIASSLKWNGKKINNLQYFIALFIICLICTLAFLFWQSISLLTFLGIFLSLWVVLSSVWEIYKLLSQRTREGFEFFKAFKMNRRLVGKSLAHAGFGALMFGATAVSTWETEDVRYMKIGEELKISGYTILFKEIELYSQSNFKKVVGEFNILKGDRFVGSLYPEKRFYVSRQEVTTEASIRPTFFDDVYLVLGNKLNSDEWVVRVYVKPFISFIWIGVVLISVGSIMSLTSNRRKLKHAN